MLGQQSLLLYEFAFCGAEKTATATACEMTTKNRRYFTRTLTACLKQRPDVVVLADV